MVCSDKISHGREKHEQTRLRLVGGRSKSLSEGFLAADQFVQGTRALDANDYFIYNNGTLFYDVDGSGKAKAVAIVTLTGAPALTYTDIYGEWN